MQTVSAGSCVFHKMPGRSQKAQSAASAEVRGQQKVLVSSVIPFPLVIFFCVGDTYILGGAAGLGHGSRNGRAGAQLGSKTRARLTQGPRAVDLLPKATRSCQSGRLGIETM